MADWRKILKNAGLIAGGAGAGAGAVHVATSRPPRPPVPPPAVTAPSGNWRKPQNGKTYQLSGTQTGAFTWQGVKSVTLLGPATIDARDKKAYTAFLNNCSGLAFKKITFRGGQLGVFVQRGSGFTFEDCEFSDNDQTGFLTNFCKSVTIRRCKGRRSRREHIVYLSDGTDGAVIEDSQFGDCGRMPIQINGSDSGFVKNVSIKNCELGPGGYGVSLSVYGADGVKAERCKFKDKVGVRTATKCPRNVWVTGCTFAGPVRVEGKDGCSAPVVKP